jgi:hypothetical protein
MSTITELNSKFCVYKTLTLYNLNVGKWWIHIFLEQVNKNEANGLLLFQGQMGF